MTDPIAEAVAAERRRAAEAVREIVRHYEDLHRYAVKAESGFLADEYEARGEVARECLAAVEGKA